MRKIYFSKSIKSLGHTPIYKMHKYFARRPHNVFRELINHYTKIGDLVFDPFGGGGVTLVEGLTEDRRIIISDVNPIASFIQKNQVTELDENRFVKIADTLLKEVKKVFKSYYTSECASCESKESHVRWFEHAYIVNCPSCNHKTLLNNDSKLLNNKGKPKNGFYVCNCCKFSFKSVDTSRIGSEIINLRFRCDKCGTQETKKPSQSDIDKFHHLNTNLEEIAKKHEVNLPTKDIPKEWDRQQEDCLHRKGFYKFSDLFTKRNLLTCGFMFTSLFRMKKEISEEEYIYLSFLVSSLLRYTNNMTFSTSSWMDGRPIAWAKHAYWTPNQFIETNPFEYFNNRVKAFKSAIKDRNKRFKKKNHSYFFQDVIDKKADYSVLNMDSGKLTIPNETVDFVLTDPPYGSNVQYGELCEFWSAWLSNINPFSNIDSSLENDAVVHRKTKYKGYSKGFDSYYIILHRIFSNCYRVLKPNRYLVYTFNNKDIRAWYAVIKATIDAGFYIEPDGIFYQEGIDTYRDTSHLRFDGTPQGDFIYTFKKSNEKIDFGSISESFEDSLSKTLSIFLNSHKEFTLGEFNIRLFSTSTLRLIKQISEGKPESYIHKEFSHTHIESFLDSQSFLNREGNRWSISGNKK